MMPPRPYTSPLTGDVWPDVRSAIGTIVGLANFLNEKRPRRKPPDGHDAAIALATEAAGSFAGVPKLVRTGEVEGRQISDAYWQAKDACAKIGPLLDEDFRRDYLFWKARCEVMRDALQSRQDVPELYAELRSRLHPPLAGRALRLAWYAAWLTEKGAANGGAIALGQYSNGHLAILGALEELDDAGVSRDAAMRIERVWRFVVAAGRLPRSPDDDDLLAAFEAALMAGEDNFASNLAKHGHGFRSEP